MRAGRPLPIVSLVLASCLLAACADGGDAGSGSSAALEGVTWVLDRGSIDALAPDAPADARVDASFEDGRVSGRSGCNSYFGGYDVDGDALTFDTLGGTEMACMPGSLMDLEAAYLAALGGVGSFRVTGDELVLTGAGATLTFTSEPPPSPEPLVGTTWTLTTIGGEGDTVSSTVVGTEVTLTLGDDGTYGGSGGCNTYGGDYEAEGDELRLGPARATKMACPGEGVMEQEQAFLAALARVATFAIEGGSLTLSDADGAFLLGFDAS
jgi:heat shock protein HslJ